MQNTSRIESLVSESLVSESLVSESLVSESLVSESLCSEIFITYFITSSDTNKYIICIREAIPGNLMTICH